MMLSTRSPLLVALCLVTLGCATAYTPPTGATPSAALAVDPTRWGSTNEGLVGDTSSQLDLLIFSHADACKKGNDLRLRDTYLGTIPLTLSQPSIQIPADQEVVLELSHTEFSLFGFEDQAGYTFGFGSCRSRVSFTPEPGASYHLEADFLFRRRCRVSVVGPDESVVATRSVTRCFAEAAEPSGIYEIGIH